jgi:hypothetical protein
LANVQSTNNLLARILIAKILDETRLAEIFRTTPVVQTDPNWRCRTWIADALSRIATDGRAVGTAQLNWRKLDAVARDYVAKKTAARRYANAADMGLPKPTWDMLEGKEVLS